MNNAEISTVAKYMLYPDFLKEQCKLAKVNGATRDFENYRYRQSSLRHKGTNEPSTDMLLQKLAGAVQTQSAKTPILLLSDGKDSMALAVAYAELGVSVETVTFLRDDDNELRCFVENTCRKLGHKPNFITSSEILNNYSDEYFLKGCSNMNGLVLDQGFFYFLFGIKIFFERKRLNPKECVIVDGLGNDETFGYIPSRYQLNSLKISQFGLWKILPKLSKQLKWYFRSPSESHGDMSALACFYPLSNAESVNSCFERLPSYGDPETIVDYRAFVRGNYHDHQCMMGKTKASAKTVGCEVIFPWLDEDLVDYIFNLPIASKYDFDKLENKLLLRKLLVEKIQWEQEKRGIDMYFDLDEDYLFNKIASLGAPVELSTCLKNGFLLPKYVGKRAMLEFMNLYGYCKAQGFSNEEFVKIVK